MTHTLHRRGEIASLEQDYSIMVMAAQRFNERGAKQKIKDALNIMIKYNPVNISGEIGGIYTGHTFDEIVENLSDQSYASAVYTDTGTLEKLLKELKAADLGMSVVVSGPFNSVFEVAHRVGLTPHTVNLSLGIFGPADLLANEDILEITTMCGHDMINPRRAEKAVARVLKGKISPERAAEKLAGSCTCGVFNVRRAADIIQKLADVQEVKSGGSHAD